MTRILIADEYEVVRAGLRGILEARPGWEVVAEAADCQEALVKAVETKPDVAIVDCDLPLISGLELTRLIRRRLPGTQILIFTTRNNEALIDKLLRAGARGVLLKSDAKRQLLDAVEMLASHRPFFTNKVTETLLESYLQRSSQSQSVLTPREREVVQLIAEGHSSKKIASILNLGVKTVETHRANVMRKLKVHSPAELVRYAVRNKIVEA